MQVNCNSNSTDCLYHSNCKSWSERSIGHIETTGLATEIGQIKVSGEYPRFYSSDNTKGSRSYRNNFSNLRFLRPLWPKHAPLKQLPIHADFGLQIQILPEHYSVPVYCSNSEFAHIPRFVLEVFYKLNVLCLKFPIIGIGVINNNISEVGMVT